VGDLEVGGGGVCKGAILDVKSRSFFIDPSIYLLLPSTHKIGIGEVVYLSSLGICNFRVEKVDVCVLSTRAIDDVSTKFLVMVQIFPRR
jgi:hypothetical protein